MRSIFKNNLVVLLLAGLLLMLVASGCSLPANQPSPEPEATDPVPEAMEPSPEAIDPAPEESQQEGLSVALDVNGVAQAFHYEVIPAVSPDSGGPAWEELPEHIVVTLDGYPVSDHLMQAQIFIYPAEDLAASEISGSQVAELETLLESGQTGERLPYLPVYNAAQVMHARVAFLDFQTGTGIRYLTQFDQAYLPINNNELLYTFQGVTSDGKYYVAVVMPVTLFGLPANAEVSDTLPAEFFDNFELYITNTVTLLNDQADAEFAPDLSLLDAMIQSIDVH